MYNSFESQKRQVYRENEIAQKKFDRKKQKADELQQQVTVITQ